MALRFGQGVQRAGTGSRGPSQSAVLSLDLAAPLGHVAKGELVDHVLRLHQVEETPETKQKKVDPEEKHVEPDTGHEQKEESEREDAGEREEPPPQVASDVLSEEEGKGRLLDRKA